MQDFSSIIIKFNTDVDLPTANKKEKKQLAYKDVEEELNLIKMSVLRLGGEYLEIKITQPNHLQKQLLDLLNITEKQIQSIAI